MKKLATVFLVMVMMLYGPMACCEKVGVICTLAEFLAGYNLSTLYLQGGKTDDIVISALLKRVPGNDTDTITIPYKGGIGFYILVLSSGTDNVYMASTALPVTDKFFTDLNKMVTTTLYATKMQKEIFDLEFTGMEGLGLMGRSAYAIGDSGSYDVGWLTATWKVMDGKGVPVFTLSVTSK